MSVNSSPDQYEMSPVSKIVSTAKHELTLPSMQFEHSSRMSFSQRGSSRIEESPRPLSLYHLKFNVNPLGNRLSGG